MKYVFSIIAALACSLSTFAQYNTEFTITDLNDERLTSAVESTLNTLVSEINSACLSKRTPKLSKMNIDERTKQSILMMWESSPFRCDEMEVVEPAMSTGSEYEVRNIPFIFPELDKNDQYHEVAVTFDRKGMITSFHMAISQNLYRQVMKSGAAVKDARRRQMILDYVEQFRTSYNTKDINFLNQVFSEDALIITGKIVKVKPTHENNFVSSVTKYNKQDKKTYINNLSRVFKNNKKIRVSFDEIKVLMHPTDADWYGVTLHQGWTSDRYHDDGWLFLLWDFTDESNPTIHVRTWQPDFNPITKEKISEEDIFGLDDVNIVN